MSAFLLFPLSPSAMRKLLFNLTHIEIGTSATEIVSTPGKNEPDEALDALIALGFPLKEATAALEKVDKTLSVEERIKLALKN